MDIKIVKDELQHIIQGKSNSGERTLIQTITSYLGASQNTSQVVENDKHHKQEETKKLIEYCEINNLFQNNKIDINSFISEGAEQKVYIKNDKFVYKLNDGIYYSTWYDYFINLQLNNYFFSETSYKLVGFCVFSNVLFALVEQPFVKANEPTNLEHVKQFLLSNGFENTRNHDYYNGDLKIILEDLHDENVLTQNGILYFIDTVFYIK